MSQTNLPKIESLTVEQKSWIPEIKQKWIDLQSTPLDREKARSAVFKLYEFAGKPKPNIAFVSSPASASLFLSLERDKNSFGDSLGTFLGAFLWNSLWVSLAASLRASLAASLRDFLAASLGDFIGDSLWASLAASLGTSLRASLSPKWAQCWATFFEMGDRLGVPFDRSKYELFMEYYENLGWIFPYEHLCIICDRPQEIYWDPEGRLHADGNSAVKFSDDFAVWAWHGVRLPEKYQLMSEQWKSEWLMEEKNAELRRVLIEGIGYDRICQNLKAQTIDQWREYTLLRIEVDVDVEPIQLLKMVCPSTNHIHALRVPPETDSAREAIKWVNWGVDPEEIAIAT